MSELKRSEEEDQLLFQLDVSIEVPPESKTGGKKLTEEEDDEYHQIQGEMTKRKDRIPSG